MSSPISSRLGSCVGAHRRAIGALAATLGAVAMTTLALPAAAQDRPALAAPMPAAAPDPSIRTDDASLVAQLPGFRNGEAQVRGIRLHYVIGGKGTPVVLLPGWPETWWGFHKLMPALARDHQVIAVDLRGMGTSDKPADGYDKKSMAADIAALVAQLGLKRVDIVGHDIGSQVAYAFAANHPELTRKVVLMDVPPLDAQVAKWPLLPALGTFGDKVDDDHPYVWWFAFHQVKGLPEDLLVGRHHIEQAWFFRYLLKDESAVDARDRAVYAAAYASRDAIRAGNAWYQAFPQDIADFETYGPVDAPMLALGGPGYAWMKQTLTPKVRDLRVVKMVGSGHFIAEEQPEATLREMIGFLRP